MSQLLSRENILNANDLTHKDVKVPQWGGTVRVRALSGAERDRFEASIVGDGRANGRTAPRNMTNIRARLCALCIVDESGKPLFKEADVAKLGEKSASALDLVFSTAQQLAGISDSDVEELEENLD